LATEGFSFLPNDDPSFPDTLERWFGEKGPNADPDFPNIRALLAKGSNLNFLSKKQYSFPLLPFASGTILRNVKRTLSFPLFPYRKGFKVVFFPTFLWKCE